MQWIEIYAMGLVATPALAGLAAALVCWRDTRKRRRSGLVSHRHWKHG